MQHATSTQHAAQHLRNINRQDNVAASAFVGACNTTGYNTTWETIGHDRDVSMPTMRCATYDHAMDHARLLPVAPCHMQRNIRTPCQNNDRPLLLLLLLLLPFLLLLLRLVRLLLDAATSPFSFLIPLPPPPPSPPLTATTMTTTMMTATVVVAAAAMAMAMSRMPGALQKNSETLRTGGPSSSAVASVCTAGSRERALKKAWLVFSTERSLCCEHLSRTVGRDVYTVCVQSPNSP